MITIKTPQEITIMAEGGKILTKIMQELEKAVRPGIATKELDRLAESLISCPPKPCLPTEALAKVGAKADKIKCSFKGYQGFPACLCTSINEEIVHAIPSSRILKEGDIISLDLGMQYKNFHTDMAITVPVGKISPIAEKLIEVTEKALEIGIEKVKPGNYLGDISRAIQKYVESQNFNVVRELCGHGIGRNIHEDPEILNSVSMPIVDKVYPVRSPFRYLRNGSRLRRLTSNGVKYFGDAKIKLKEGMVLCLEPMVTVGDWRIKKSADGYGWQTKDSSLSCHFEHTVAVVKDGFQILTQLEQ